MVQKMIKKPEGLEFGSASFYGTESGLKSVISRYLLHPASSDFYVRTKNSFLEEVLSSIRNGGIVLDIGCSFGFVTCEIADIYRRQNLDSRVMGIDIIQAQIDNAKAYAKYRRLSNTEFHLCDAREIKALLAKELTSDDRLSLVLSLYSFHHIPDFPADSTDGLHKYKINVLEQLYSAADKGAALIIGDITVPVSYRDKEYYSKAAENIWLPPRIEAAKAASDVSAELEKNAALGVINRHNEYPLTLDEYAEILGCTGWTIFSKEIIAPYSDVVLHCRK